MCVNCPRVAVAAKPPVFAPINARMRKPYGTLRVFCYAWIVLIFFTSRWREPADITLINTLSAGLRQRLVKQFELVYYQKSRPRCLGAIASGLDQGSDTKKKTCHTIARFTATASLTSRVATRPWKKL